MELNTDFDIFFDEEEEIKKEKRKERRKNRENSKIPKNYFPNQREINWFLVISCFNIFLLIMKFEGRVDC